MKKKIKMKLVIARTFEGHNEKKKNTGGVDRISGQAAAAVVRLCRRSIVGGGVRRAPRSRDPAARAPLRATACGGARGGDGRTTTTIVTEAAAACSAAVVVVGGGEGAAWSARPPCSCFDDAEYRARRPHPTPPSDVI